jgi:hypothetical protein
MNNTMPEFLFDLTCTATARLTADDLESAVRALNETLNCLDPQITIGQDDVTGAVTEISLGLATPGQHILSLVEVDGESATADLELDKMTTPVLCDRWDSNDADCEQVYDEAGGDGYLGLCPHCADVTDSAE